MKKKFIPYYCDKTFVNVVLPIHEIVTDETEEWLIIGYAGVDGIEFRTKADATESEVFAFYPIEQDYVKVAGSVDDLVDKWKLGHLTL